MNKQVSVSKDVVVDKTKHWDWNHEVENGPTQVLFDSNKMLINTPVQIIIKRRV